VTLLGQTVNSYRDPLPSSRLHPARAGPLGRILIPPLREDESEFAALLRAVWCAALARLRYTSPHPRHLTASLIRTHQELPVLVRHGHSVQAEATACSSADPPTRWPST
jgi:tRNA-2-methylthio-N6-dimethylallyladenosine synthase